MLLVLRTLSLLPLIQTDTPYRLGHNANRWEKIAKQEFPQINFYFLKFKFQVVDQLFARLDSDGDGRVAFEDLLDMFQSGGGGGSGLAPEGEQQQHQDSQNVFEGEEPQSQEQVS